MKSLTWLRKNVPSRNDLMRLAHENGQVRFSTGKPCTHGHMAERFTSSGSCVECAHDRVKKSRKDDPDRAREITRQSYHRNHQARLDGQAEYRNNNRPLKAYHESLRRARKKQAAPKWLTDDQKSEMKSMYLRAWELGQQTGDLHTVDHIVPLKGKNVCGLHVPWNLQILLFQDNCAKKNNHTT